jgi:hypothetical protein
MSIAFKAMQFAREAHKDQVRKYTGDIRTSPVELIDAMAALYVVGVRVSIISGMTGIPIIAIRNYVAKHDLDRDPSLFETGVSCIAGEGEEFLRLPWAPDYFASNFGRIVGMTSSQPGTILKPSKNPENEYFTVKLVESDGMARHNYVHRTVLRVFRGEAATGIQGAHGDGNKSNNRLDNLRWDNPVGNAADKIEHGTLLIGSTHPNSKINEETAATIKRMLATGKRQAEISRELSIHISCVANIAQDKTWKHVGSAYEHSV